MRTVVEEDNEGRRDEELMVCWCSCVRVGGGGGGRKLEGWIEERDEGGER